MKRKSLLFLPILLFLLNCFVTNAQVVCPDNIDFEQGTLGNWECATGRNNATSSYGWTVGAPIAGVHTIMSGTGVDPYGNFPVVAPGGGMYSLKLGNDGTGAQAEKVRYTLKIPVGTDNYNLIYRYAVVFQDAGHHPAAEQPFFRVSVTDSATGLPLSCNTSTLISTSNLPGFIESSPGSEIWYKDWSAASLRIGGLAGHTIYIEFITADCSQNGHFGYGYVDLNCNGYAITSANCNGAVNTPLVGPPGFMQYDWYDSSFASPVGTGQTIYIPSPATSNYYNLIVTPFAGFGCVDTLSTRIAYSNLSVTATPEITYLCNPNVSVRLGVSQVGSAPPYTYSWTPVASLSCVSCTTPTATPTVSTNYVVAVTDSIGCTITDTAFVITGVTVASSQTNILCFGAHNGTASVVASGGLPPYSYSWNSNPTQTTATASNLGPGTYTVTVRDANGCAATSVVSITQPSALSVAGTLTNITCNGRGDGSILASASGGTAPYTYAWNTSPVQSTPVISGLRAGSYTCTVTDLNGCVATMTKNVTDPPRIVTQTRVLTRPCEGLSGGSLTISSTGGTGPIQHYWYSGIYAFTDTVRYLMAGTYLVQTSDANGCIKMDTILLTAYSLPMVSAGLDASICAGDSVVLTASGAHQYSWQPGNFLNCTNCAQPFAKPDSTRTFYLTGTDINGCINKDSVSVEVIQKVEVGIDTTKYMCPGDKVTLGAYGGESYEWSPGKSLSGVQFSNPIASPDSTTTYRVIITQNRCFKDTLEQTVVVMPKPSVKLGADFFGIPGAVVTLETEVADAERITWTPPAGLSCTDCYAPVASLDTNISYIAEVVNSYGCTDRDTINIRVSCDGAAFYVANTFTPNGDGQNDFFYPQGLGINSVKRMMVYDRWGETVFSATDIPANVPARGWDGSFRNKQLPPDVFLYVIETICKDGSPIVLKGDVTLVR